MIFYFNIDGLSIHMGESITPVESYDAVSGEVSGVMSGVSDGVLGEVHGELRGEMHYHIRRTLGSKVLDSCLRILDGSGREQPMTNKSLIGYLWHFNVAPPFSTNGDSQDKPLNYQDTVMIKSLIDRGTEPDKVEFYRAYCGYFMYWYVDRIRDVMEERGLITHLKPLSFKARGGIRCPQVYSDIHQLVKYLWDLGVPPDPSPQNRYLIMKMREGVMPDKGEFSETYLSSKQPQSWYVARIRRAARKQGRIVDIK